MTTITGTPLDDLLRGSLTDDVIEGLDGNDDIQGGAGLNILRGGNGDDFLWSTAAGDHADGGAGKDEFFSLQQDSTIAFTIDITASDSSGNIGNGTSFSSIEVLAFYGGTKNDKLTGGAFTDYLAGNGGNDRITGGAGNDNLDGGTGNDVVLGGDGDDNIGSEFALGFDTGLGSDIINGGAGTDYLILNREDTLVNLVLDISAGGGNTNIGDGSRISGIERIWFRGGEVSNTITGGALDDLLEGYIGNDTFNGGGGNDVLAGDRFGFGGSGSINKLNGDSGNDLIIAKGGTDLVDGGADFDSLWLSRENSTANLTVDISAGGTGLDIGDGSTILGIEQIDARGGSGNDRLIGGAFSDYLFGGSGTNTLSAGGGDDEIYAGGGQFGAVFPGSVDIVNGGAGADFLNLNRSYFNGNLTLDISAGGGNVNIGDGSRISNIERLVFVGGNGNDTVTGGNLDDEIDGGLGNNTLSGGGGSDTINSQEEAVDIIDGGAGDDHLIMDRSDFLNFAIVDLVIDLTAGGGGTDIGDGSKISSIESMEVVAGFGNDSITGGSGDDKIGGAGGLNVLNGGGGNDFILSDGIDIIDGGSGDDFVEFGLRTQFGNFTIDLSSGGGGSDIGDGTTLSNVEGMLFRGGSGNHSITGGLGDDIVEVHSGVSALDGGAGIDFLKLNLSASGIAIQLNLSAGGGGLDIGNGTTVANFERLLVLGSSNNNTLTGGALDDELLGGSANDTLNGGGGKDLLFGGDGNDTIISLDNQGTGTLDGGFSGVDTLVLNRASQTTSLTIDLNDSFIFRDIGDGTKISNFERINLVSGSGGDLITGGSANDSIDARAGNDTVFGSAGIDSLRGGAGDADVLSYTGNVTYAPVGLVIDLVAGKTTTSLANDTDTFSGFEAYFGSTAADTLLGDGTANELYGGDGDDRVRGGAGDDYLNGGGGASDTADYSAAASGVTVNLSIAGPQAVGGGEGSDTLIGFENIAGSALNDTLVGNSLDNILTGNGGIDTVDWSAATGAIFLALDANGSGTASNTAGIGQDTVASIENIIGGSGGDSLTGNAQANVLNGGIGNDTLDGGAGADTMIGGIGNDTYFDTLGDTITEAPGAGYDTVNTTRSSYSLAAALERVNFAGVGNFIGTGNALNNRFQGGTGDDRFVDVLGGADIFSGGAGTDTVDFRTSAIGVVIDFATNIHGGAAAGDSYSGIEKFLGSNAASDTMTMGGTGRALFVGGGGDDLLTGGVKNDQVLGQGGNDTLSGGADRDSLDGGTGDDTMTGGAADDVFVFIDAAFGQDIITDFTDGADSFKVFSAVADSIADFTITGNGTTSVTLELIGAPTNTITINGAAPITIAADDFVFY